MANINSNFNSNNNNSDSSNNVIDIDISSNSQQNGIILYNPTSQSLTYTNSEVSSNLSLPTLASNQLQNLFITNLVRNTFPPSSRTFRIRPYSNLELDDEDEVDDEEEELLENTAISADQFLTGITGLLLNSRYNGSNTLINRSTQLSNLLLESFNQKSAYKNVLSEEGENQLTKLKFKDSSKANSSCPIYYLDFEEDSDVIQLPCKHVFTPNGIEKWLKEEKNECPICRFELKSKEVPLKKKINDPSGNLDISNNSNTQFYNSLQSSYAPLAENSYGNIPHSYLDTLFAREEEEQMEQAILESIRDFESQNNEPIPNEENNSESNHQDSDNDSLN